MPETIGDQGQMAAVSARRHCRARVTVALLCRQALLNQVLAQNAAHVAGESGAETPPSLPVMAISC
jgi:hypothetical protein